MSSKRSRTNVDREAGASRELRSCEDLEGMGFVFGIPAGPARRQSTFEGWVKVVRFALPTVGLLAALGGMVALTLGAGCTSKKAPPAEPSTTAPLAQVTGSQPTPAVLDVHPTALTAAPASAGITLPAGPVVAPDAPQATAPTTPGAVPAGSPLAKDPVFTQTPRLAFADAGGGAGSATPGASGATSGTPAGVTSRATSAPATSAGPYTVQKGDTLFKIAKEHYGDGKQWSRIVAANPGLSPASLKAGQKLNLP